MIMPAVSSEKRKVRAKRFAQPYASLDKRLFGAPKSVRTCEGKVVEVDGIKYELNAL